MSKVLVPPRFKTVNQECMGLQGKNNQQQQQQQQQQQ